MAIHILKRLRTRENDGKALIPTLKSRTGYILTRVKVTKYKLILHVSFVCKEQTPFVLTTRNIFIIYFRSRVIGLNGSLKSTEYAYIYIHTLFILTRYNLQ